MQLPVVFLWLALAAAPLASAQEEYEQNTFFEIPIACTPQTMAQTGQLLSDRVASNTYTNRFINMISAAVSFGNSSNDVGLTTFPHVMTEYRATVSVGTPARAYSLLLDTGSFDMWIYGVKCPSPACQTAKNKYDVTRSSTGVDLKTPALGGKYADGSGYGGDRVTDTVSIGPATLNAFQFTQVTSYVSQGGSAMNPSDNDSDGIVGMGFKPQTSNSKVTNSFIDQVIATKALSKNIFSYYIDVEEMNGVVTLGGYNPSYFQNSSSQPSWVPILTDSSLASGKLALPLYRVWVDKTKVEEFTSHASSSATGGSEGTTGSAIMDTGTSQAIVSNLLIDAIGTRLKGAQKIYLNGRNSGPYTYVMDCSLKSENAGPTVTLEFAGGVTASMTALEYVSAPVNGQCQLVLQGMNGGFKQGTYLIGNTFLKRFVTVFDYDKMRIGFVLGVGRSTNASVSYDATLPGYTQGPLGESKFFGSMTQDKVMFWGSLLFGVTAVVILIGYCLRYCMRMRGAQQVLPSVPFKDFVQPQPTMQEYQQYPQPVYVPQSVTGPQQYQQQPQQYQQPPQQFQQPPQQFQQQPQQYPQPTSQDTPNRPFA
ncbi:aspartic peptidase domain-containing protein [Obelidium mucronatum]|nr:aspartic peptidase domain-containing protein [Obelidium mucronatum]